MGYPAIFRLFGGMPPKKNQWFIRQDIKESDLAKANAKALEIIGKGVLRRLWPAPSGGAGGWSLAVRRDDFVGPAQFGLARGVVHVTAFTLGIGVGHQAAGGHLNLVERRAVVRACLGDLILLGFLFGGLGRLGLGLVLLELLVFALAGSGLCCGCCIGAGRRGSRIGGGVAWCLSGVV